MVTGLIQIAESVHSSDDVIMLHLDGLNYEVILRVRSKLAGKNHVVSGDLHKLNSFWKLFCSKIQKITNKMKKNTLKDHQTWHSGCSLSPFTSTSTSLWVPAVTFSIYTCHSNVKNVSQMSKIDISGLSFDFGWITSASVPASKLSTNLISVSLVWLWFGMHPPSHSHSPPCSFSIPFSRQTFVFKFRIIARWLTVFFRYTFGP